MPNVTMPNGDVVAFPDDMPRENIRALITKKFPTAEREAAANSGARPYDNALQTMGKAVQGTPGNIQLGVSGVSEMARTGGAGDPNALIDKLGPDFTLSERPGIDEANLIQWGRKQIGVDTATPLTPEQRRQIEALARTPGAGQAFASYLSDPNSIRAGSSPEVVAKESLRGQLERKEIGKSIPAIDARPGSAEELAANVTSSVAQMAPGYLASAITRNPLPTVALAQTLTTGQAYGQARDAGLEPSKAAEYAMTNGFAEAVGEALPLGMILKEGGGKLLPKLFKAGAAEGLQESVTQFIQSMLQSGSITPDMTWGDVKNQVIQAAATGAVAGGVLTAATSGVEALANRGRGGQPSPEEVSAEVLNPPANATDPAVPDDTVAIEDMLALPAPGVMLALPSPDAFTPPLSMATRRQGAAPVRENAPETRTTTDGKLQVQFGRDGEWRDATMDASGHISSPDAERDQANYHARIAMQKTRQAETAELLKTARETVTPLGTFDRSELPGDAAQRVGVWRQRLGKAIDGPISIEDMARARVPQSQIDAAIALRRPLTEGVTISPAEVRLAAEQRNIIATDGNFKELAYRATGGRDLERMTQAQLKALKSTLEAMPTHATPVTLPLAEASPFTEGQYSKGLDAIRTQGRFTLKALKDATGLTSDKDARAIRDAMVRRGQLVQRSASDYRLYDIAGAERQAVPDDLPKGAFSEHVVKRLPVSRIQIRQNGKSIGSFGSGAEARSKIRDLRAAEAEKGGTPSQIELSHGDEAAFGVMENRYDAEGNLLGQVVVDTARDESAARALADQRNNPVASPTFEGPFTTHLPRGGRIMDAPPAANESVSDVDAAVDGALPYLSQKSIIENDAEHQKLTNEWERLTSEINAGMLTGDQTATPLSGDEARIRIAQRDKIGERMLAIQARARKEANVRGVERATLREKLTAKTAAPTRRAPPAALAGRVESVLAALNKTAATRGLPLLGTKVSIKHDLTAPDGAPVKGMYLRNLISLTAANLTPSMNDAEVIDSLTQVMDHELIHALKHAGVLGPESDGWKTIARYAARTRRPNSTQTYMEWADQHYAGLPGYETSEDRQEEAIAEAFRVWAANRRDVVGKPATVFRQLVEWFRNVLNRIPKEVFSAIETGQLVRDALTPPGASQPRARNTKDLAEARAGIAAAQAAGDAPAVVARSRQFLRARAQGREDRYGRSGPKTVLGTTPSRAFESAERPDRSVIDTITERYRQQAGLSASGLSTYLPEDQAYLTRLADAQQKGVHNPEANDVAKAYRSLVTETRAMFDALGDLTVEPWQGDGAPYASPAAMLADVTAGRLKMRLTDEMFGPSIDYPHHPMNEPSGRAASDGRPLTNNDLFRVVHDIYGRGPLGLRGSARDEYNAYHEHARLLSPEARRALATETLAQSAWHNLGPHLRRPDGTVPRPSDVDYLPGVQKEFSEQKAFLVPEALIAADPGWALADDAARAQEDGDLPKFSRFADDLPGGRMYGNPNRSPGGALSKPGTPSPAFTAERDGNRFFGGEMADEQLRMAREGIDGATMLYLSPDDFLALADQRPNPEQAVYDATIDAGYKLSTLPSLVLDGYAGNVRVVDSDSVAGVRALAGKTDAIPVAIYPKRKENLGLVTALEANGVRVPWPAAGRAENFPDVRGPRYSVDTERFKEWFGDSKVVNADGSPRVVYHGTRKDFTAFQPNIRKTDQLGFGVHFAVDKDFANRYANDPAVARKGPNPHVVEAFLMIRNPLVANRIVREGEPEFALAKRLAGSRLFTTKDENDVPSVWLQNALDVASPAKAQQAIQEAGYDGVQYESRIVSQGVGATTSGRSMSFIAFEPTQIKSAIANNGQYSATDPDIRYSLSAPFGTRVPPDQPTFNIIGQRVEGYVGKTLANIGRSKRPIPFIGSVFDLRIKQQDKMLSVKEMIENIETMGGKVGDDTNTYMVEQLAGSRTVHQVEHREETLYEPLFAGLKAAASGPNPVTVKQFEDFLYARHAPERNTYLRARGSKVANPSGMSDSEAGAILDRFALAGQLGTLERLAVLADAISANTTATRLDAGLISDKAANGSPYKHYIPLRGKTEEDLDPEDVYDPQTRARSGKGYTVGGKEDRSATGRERKAGDLISHLVLQNTESVIRAEKNRVALSFMRLIADNPQTGYGTILESVPTRMVVGANGMIREAGDPSYRQRPDVFTAKYKGTEIVAQVGDPRVARAMKSDYVTQSGAFINALGRLNRYLATINTSWNPEFLVSNIARDLQTAGLLGAQYDIKGLPGKIIKGAPAAVVGIREVLRDGTATTPMALAFRELQEAGGTTEFMGIHDLETHIKRLRKDAASTGLNTTARQAWQHVQNLGKFIDDYNKVAENAFRLSSYVAARDAGASIAKAAYLAKNLTINFNKGGENKATMNALYLFYNASISGTFVLLNGLKSKRVQKLVAGIVAAGFIQDLIARAMSGDEDDNGVKDYDDIPDYVLQNNWVFMTGGKNYVSVPMPYGFNVFHNLGRNLSNAFSGSPVHSPGKSAMSMLSTALGAFNPMGGSNSALNFIAPTIADPLVDLVSNRDFAGNSIVPERPSFGVPVPDSQKYWSNTGDIPKWVAEHLNAMTGGNELRKGWIDYSPEVLQYWFDYATGATGKFITRNTNTAQKTLQGDFEDIKIGDIPFARRVVGTVDNRGNTERYYENATQVQTVAAELKLATEKGDATLGRSTLANYPAEVRLIDTFDKGEKALAGMRQEIRAIKDAPSLPEAKKREAIKQIREQQDRVMAQLNKIYFAQKAATGQR